MLEIVELNSKTSNNNIRLVVATLTINITRLVATTLTISITRLATATLAIPVIAIPPKLIALTILVIATPFKHSPYKAIRGYAASNITWSNYIKAILSKLVNVIIK